MILRKFVDQLLALRLRILGLLDLLAEDDLDRALGAHHADLGRRPGHDQVGLVGAAAHHVVAGAVGLAQHDRDLRHGRVRGRVQHLRAVADDPGLLDLGPDHEARDVHQVDERDPVGVAEVDEPRRLVGGVVVEDPAELPGLVGDDPRRPAAEPRQAGDDRLGPLRLEVEVDAVVDDPADHLVHVVRLAVGLREDVEQLLVAAVDRVLGRHDRRRLLAVLREVAQVLLDPLDALLVVGDLEVADPRLAAVHARAAELLLGDVLADRRPHQVRSGQRHRPAPLDHRHEVGQPRDVRRAGRARPHQRRDLRDHAAD